MSESLNYKEGLGDLEICLNVKDLQESLNFYKKLGFKLVGGEIDENWAIIQYETVVIGLFQGHIKKNVLNFRKADVFKVAKELYRQGLSLKQDAHWESDGSAGATIEDPDGNIIYFNTHPDEVK